MSDSVTKQIEGVCEEISEKNGWTSFAINVGSNYPVRLSTKLPALIDKGRAVGQQNAVWTFKESQGGENPNKPGTFYTNRYFDDVEVGGMMTAEPGGTIPASRNAESSGRAPLASGDKDRAITRMAVLKAAADACSGAQFAPGEDIAAVVIEVAARFETWVMRDVDSIPFG